jgi:hypothetical protein
VGILSEVVMTFPDSDLNGWAGFMEKSIHESFFDEDDPFGDPDLSFEDYENLKKILGPSETVWQTRTGKNIPVVEMGDAHIINTILMLERTHRTHVATYPTLLVEARKRNLPLDKIIKVDNINT